MKLTPKLALIFISFAILLVLGVGLLAYEGGRRALEAATFAELESTSLEKSSAIDNWVADRKADIAALSHSPTLLKQFESFLDADTTTHSAREQLIQELLVRTGPDQPYLDLFILSGDSGEILIATNPLEEGKFKEDRPYFIEGKTTHFVSKVYYSFELRGPAITASAPLRTEDGELLGVLAARLNMEELNAIVQRRSGLRQTDDAFLVNASNLFVTQPHLLPDPAVLQRGIHTPAVRQCLQARLNGTLSTLDYRDVPAIITYRWLPEHEMCLIVKMDRAEALAPVHALGRTIVWIGLVTLMIASGLAFVLARSMIRPILAMQSAAQGYGQGRLDLRLPETRPDELGTLAHEFNQMAGALAEKELELRMHAQTLEQKVQERTRELQEAHAQLLRAEQIGQIGSWVWYVPENRVVASEGLQTLLGLTAQDFGNTFEAYFRQIHPEDVEHMQQTVQQALETGNPFEIETRIFRKDGQVRTFYARGESLLDEQGDPRRIMGVTIDVTERRQAEVRLQESEARYRGLIESQLDLIVRVDPQGCFTFVNDAYCQKFGLTRQQILGQENFQPLVHPDDLPHTLEAMQALYQPPYRATITQRAFAVEGMRWIEWQDSAIRDESGRIVEIQAIGRDITERKQAEEALHESEQHLKRAQEIAHLGSWELDLLKNQLTWSDEVYRIFGLQPQEFGATYEAFLDAVHPEDRAAVNDAYSGSIREGRDRYEIEHRVVRRSTGDVRTVHEKCEHFRDPEGQIIRSVGMVHDITERKRAQQELHRTLEELKHSNAELEQFAYVASHDLQEPLRMVSSYMQLLKRRYQGKLDQDADEFIAFAVDGATRMQNLINDLLAFSRVGTRGRPMGLSSCEKALTEALINLQVAVEESQAVITHDPLPTVFCDQPQLVQLFQNLLVNSIKFRGQQAPQIHISAKREHNEWLFSVRDNGIGLDPKFGERIFEIFQRLHNRTAYPGTGIGLAICKRIVQRHGGRIWVESQPGQGATFYFTLPIKETP
jgi:PAS domain S-box-containing protein